MFQGAKAFASVQRSQRLQNAHDALVVQGTLLVFLVPCSTHLWCAPDALGQAHYFRPGMVQQQQGLLVCLGCSAQYSMIGIPGRHAAVHHWHVTGMPPGCGGQPRACPSLQLAAARPRAAQEGGGMGTGREARRGGREGGETHFPDLRLPAQPTTDLRPRPKPNRWVAGI